MSASTDVVGRALPDVLAELRREAPPTDRVLSVYLDTSPARMTSQAYLLTYRDLCKSLRPQLPKTEQDRFEAAAAQAESYLVDRFVPHQAGLAIFASGTPEYFLVADLPRRVPEQLLWDQGAVVEPLEEILGEEARAAVALFDARRARLFTVYLGQIEDRQAFEDDVPPRQKAGGWAALVQSRLARHRDDHLLHHAKRTIQALLTMDQKHPFERLILGGPPEALSVLKHQLPATLWERVAGTISVELFASDDVVLRAAREVVDASKQQTDLARVGDLMDNQATARVEIGLDATLAALSEGRVHALLLANTLGGVGGECPSCGRLVAGPAPCPNCGVPTNPFGNVAERAADQAVAQGARVDVVAGEAASLLMTQGGIGAWTRY